MAIIQTTIQGLRTANRVSINPGDLYYVTDKGQEGYWRSDDGSGNREESSSLVDNLGVTLNTGWSGTTPPSAFPQAILRRVYDGYVNVKWFGAKGDGNFNPNADDTLAIQRAISYISKTNASPVNLQSDWNIHYGGGTLFFPSGVYVITNTLYIGQHCRLLGVSVDGYKYPLNELSEQYRRSGDYYQTGSVIRCRFGRATNRSSWAIESDCLWTDVAANPPCPNSYPLKVAGSRLRKSETAFGFDYDPLICNGTSTGQSRITLNPAILIEGLVIDCREYKTGEEELIGDVMVEIEYPRAYGGIKLTGAPNSSIKNCTIQGPNIGILMSACWGGLVEKNYCNTLNYGIVTKECNGVLLVANYLAGSRNQISEELPEFLNVEMFQGLGLFDSNASIGIALISISSIALNENVIENYNAGVFAYWCNFSAVSTYLELIVDYGFIVTGPVQAVISQTRLIGMPTGFYFGEGPRLTIDNVCVDSDNVSRLYETNDILLGWRNVNFSEVSLFKGGVWSATPIPALPRLTGKRHFKEDIFFLDEIGDTVYVDSSDANNAKNIGFSSLDPVYSIDDAIRRCYYSGRKVKRILIKKGTTAIKDAGERYLEAFDVFISTYGESTQPTRIQFQGTGALGQMSIKGMVRIHIKDVDLICSTTQPTDYSMSASIFRINFGHLELKLESMRVDLGNGYSLVAGDYSAGNLQKSFLTTRWVNVAVDGAGEARLSPYQWGAKNLMVDCLQYGAVVNNPVRTKPNKGWDDVEIINNNII